MNQVITKNSRSVQILQAIVVLVVVLVPFYAFFTTWLSTVTGGLLVLRAWKELLLLPAVCIAVYILCKDATLRKRFFQEKLIRIMLVFAAWLLVATLLHGGGAQSIALGLAIQLRLFVIFMLARIVAYYRPPSRQLLERIILIPVVGVVSFGLLQMFVLPYDFLKHFGYQKDLTIPPYFTIDEQLNKIRIASTLRGPNPLGVYLILPILVVAQKVWEKKKPLLGYGVLLAASLVVLYGSHSRGAWIGTMAALVVWILLTVSRKAKLVLISLALLLGMASGLAIYTYRNTGFVQDVVLHDNPEAGGEISSNQGHLDSAKVAVDDILNNPVDGCGAGCAGPASVRSKEGPNFAENYYLQTAQEAGTVGLLLLLTISGLLAYALLVRSRWNSLDRLLLAAFVGVSIASLFAHSWADDTVAYLWWGIAGLNMTWPAVKSAKKPESSETS